MQTLGYYIGLELGGRTDFTTLAILRREMKRYPTRAESFRLDVEHHYQLGHLERFEMGTSLPDITEHLATLLLKPPLENDSSLIIDATGVALPVSQSLAKTLERARAVRYNSVSHALITTGDSVVKEYPVHRIPKRDLASTLQMVLQWGRLKIAPDLPLIPVLKAEMEKFNPKILPPAEGDFLSWREGAQDDLVLAVALACWAGEHLGRVLTCDGMMSHSLDTL